MKNVKAIWSLSTRQPVFKIELTPDEEREAVKEFTEILDASFALQDGIAAAKADDGKIDGKDFLKFFPFLQTLPTAISGADKVLFLFKNFSPSAKQQIKDHIDAGFDIADDKKEALIERSIHFLLKIVEPDEIVAYIGLVVE